MVVLEFHLLSLALLFLVLVVVVVVLREEALEPV
jgi:hypothetical protein